MFKANNSNHQTAKLSKEIKNLSKVVRELNNNSVRGSKRLLNMEQAATYTGRSRRTFQKECRKGLWTSIQMGGSGHPKFRPEDLDRDLEAWAIYSKFRKHEGVRA